jgi:hypothetical protein
VYFKDIVWTSIQDPITSYHLQSSVSSKLFASWLFQQELHGDIKKQIDQHTHVAQRILPWQEAYLLHIGTQRLHLRLRLSSKAGVETTLILLKYACFLDVYAEAWGRASKSMINIGRRERESIPRVYTQIIPASIADVNFWRDTWCHPRWVPKQRGKRAQCTPGSSCVDATFVCAIEI